MKKFIFMLIAMFTLAISAANAQVTTKNASFGDNWFVGLNIGAISYVDHSFDWAKHDWLGNYHKEFGVEVGKWITPVVGLGLSYEAVGGVNSSKTWADMGLTTADAHFNLTNLFAGYKGTPRAFEVELIPSVGFANYYGDAYPAPHRFMALGRAAVSANYNFGADKQWAVYVRPAIQYVDRVRHYNGLFDVRVGVTYKFKGTKSKAHNFVACPYAVTQADYDKALAEIDALKNAPANVVTQNVEVVKEVSVNAPENLYTVSFAQNSAVLTDEAKAILDRVPANATVDVAGSTSPEGTSVRNEALAQERADAVAKYLANRGVTVSKAVGGEAGRVAIVSVK